MALMDFFERIEQMAPEEIEAEILQLPADDALLLLNQTRARMLDNIARSDKELVAGILLAYRLRSLRTNRVTKKFSKPDMKVITDLTSLL